MATVSQQIQQIYIGLLGRAADQAGLDYWTAEIEGGVLTLEQLRANIVNEQPEYAAGQGSMTRPQAVADLYENLFNRAPEAAGLEYWVSGGGASVNIDQLVLALINGASASDQLVLDNKTEVAEYYTAAAGADYSADAAAGAVANVDGTRDSVDAAKTAIDSGAVATGQTYMLTTGIDTPVGTSGNDEFVANNDTWNVGDNISGGAGTDTLVLANENEDLTLAGRTLTSIEKLTIINVDPDTGDQDFNFANKMLDEVTIDFANTENLSYVYADNLRADTDLVVTNVITDGYYVYRNYDEVFSTLEGSVSQSNTFTNIDVSVNDSYIWFENYAYFSAATELNLTETWADATTGGTTSTGSDEYLAYSGNYVDLQAENAVVNVTYNLTNLVAPDGYSYVELYVDSGETADVADTVNATYNIDNVDGLEIYTSLLANYSSASAESGDSDVLTINVGSGGLLNSDGSNDITADEFETINLNIDGDAEFEDIDTYSNISAAQTVNIVANADLTVSGTWDFADDQEVTINITGAGNVAFDMNGDNYGVTVNAADATGDLTLAVGSDATYATVVTTGSGDDTITLLNAFELNADGDAFLQVIDGGDGTDTFEINTDDLVTSQALLGSTADAPEDFSAAIMNFERLSLTGFAGQDIDATTMGFSHVTIDGYITGGSLTVEAGATVVVTGTGATDAEIIIDGAATGSQTLNLTVNGADGITLNDLTVADVETINVVSSASAPDATTPGANTVDLIAAAATTLSISGATELVFGATADFTKVATVAAGDFDAGLTIDLTSSTVATTLTVGDGDNTITGSAQVDTITTGAGYDIIVAGAGNDVISTGNGGSEITGGAGKDTITLGSGITEDDIDTIIYTAVGDSQGVTVDVINGFQANVLSSDDIDDDGELNDYIDDVIDLSAVVIGTATYAGEANGYGAVLTSLTGDLTNSQAVLDTSTSTLYVDVNADGILDSNDMAIQLTGVTDLSAANFAFV